MLHSSNTTYINATRFVIRHSSQLHSYPPLLFCVMSTANTKYPPTEHTYHDESAAKPAVTSSQPRANATMAVGSNNDQARMGKAERIRGGCVPCPVCVES